MQKNLILEDKIWLCGDIHGDLKAVRDIMNLCSFDDRYNNILIVLGDFGANYFLNYRDVNFKRKISKYNLTIFVVRGNHEKRPSECMLDNPDKWELEPFWNNWVYVEKEFPCIKYALDIPAMYQNSYGSMLVYPGAYSPDKDYRLKIGYSWFPTEQMNEHEKFMGKTLLNVCGHEVDFILSHTCPRIFEPYISDLFFSSIDQSKVDKTTEIYLNSIIENCKYKHYYFGHYHDNRNIIPYNATMLFHNIIELGEKL